MRRTLHRLTVGTAAITALTLASAPAWADGGAHIEGDGSSRSVTVEAKDPGSGGGGKSSGGGGSSSGGGGESSGGGQTSAGGTSPESETSSGGGSTSEGGRTSVSHSERTDVGNYSGGSSQGQVARREAAAGVKIPW